MKVDPKLEAIAIKVMDKMELSNSKNDKYGNIILVIMIIGIILSLIRVIQECNKGRLLNFNRKERSKLMHSEIQNICISKNVLNTWRLKRIIKQKLNPEDYKSYGTQLRNAIFSTGIELSEQETYTLVEAANV